LVQLGVTQGDEVICQSFTFSASANPIAYQGAKPVFVGSEPDTWNMDPELLRVAIEDRIAKTGKKPKAIIPVHLYGMPARMDEIMAIANEYGIPVLEDAAEALGSEYRGLKCGTFGEFACLSFNGNKMITTSGGGALVCRTAEEAERTKFFATQARDKAPHYQHSHIGYNYRMSNICAGIGRGQMYVLEEHIARRREINQLYRTLLQDVPGIAFHTNPDADFESNYWLTCIVIDSNKAGFTREDLRLRMEQENIETRPLWKPMHLQPVFADCPYYGDNTEGRLFDDGLCLPSGPTLTDKDIERVAGVIRKLHRNKI
jgi:dTDP-4-amino-4,6-dideoxygalactose transaminase